MANQQQKTGAFVPTTQIFEANEFRRVDVNSQQFKDLLVLMHQQLNQMALVLNLKTTGYYLEEQFNNSNQWFNPNSTSPLNLRPEYHKVVDLGTVNAGVNPGVPHGITVTATTKWVYIGGAGTNSTAPSGVPFPNAGAAYVSVTVDATNVVVDNNSGVVFDTGYIILKWLEF